MQYPYAVNVVQEALATLGQTDLPEVVDTADADPKRRVFATLYESARKKVLLEHPWNFLRVIQPTASGELGRTKEGRRLYATPIPGDCFRLLGARDENGDPVAHRRIGQELQSEAPIGTLEYLRDEPDPERLLGKRGRRTEKHAQAANPERQGGKDPDGQIEEFTHTVPPELDSSVPEKLQIIGLTA